MNKDDLSKCGIYWIWHGDTLLYIGQTNRSYKVRFQEHKTKLKSGKHRNKTLMKYVTDNNLTVDDLDFKILHITKDNSSWRLDFAESGFTQYYKPLCCKPCKQIGLKYMSYKEFELTEHDIELLKELC